MCRMAQASSHSESKQTPELRSCRTKALKHYYHERIHQGSNRIIEPRHEANDGEIFFIERLSGLLKSYHRKAA